MKKKRPVSFNESIVRKLTGDVSFETKIKELRSILFGYQNLDKKTLDELKAIVLKEGFYHREPDVWSRELIKHRGDPAGFLTAINKQTEVIKEQYLQNKYFHEWKFYQISTVIPEFFLHGRVPNLTDPKRQELFREFGLKTAMEIEGLRTQHGLHVWWRNSIIEYVIYNKFALANDQYIMHNFNDVFGTPRIVLELHPAITDEEVLKAKKRSRKFVLGGFPTGFWKDIELLDAHFKDRFFGTSEIFKDMDFLMTLTEKEIEMFDKQIKEACQRIRMFYSFIMSDNPEKSIKVYELQDEVGKKIKDDDVIKRNKWLAYQYFDVNLSKQQLLQAYQNKYGGRATLDNVYTWARRGAPGRRKDGGDKKKV